MAMNIDKSYVRVIGGGLAGSEASLLLARLGIKVKLIDMKPSKLSKAHHDKDHLAELVCSNSLKSEDPLSAAGILKGEMERLGSVVIEASKIAKVPSGQDLAVDRDVFSKYITDAIKSNKNIEIVDEDVQSIPDDGILTIVCTGPLTSDGLSNFLAEKIGKSMLSFFDAAAPLIFKSSIDTSRMFEGSRYGKGEGKYLNIPMSKEQYEKFNNELINAQRAILHDFDHFEGCLPLEVMAKRGPMTLRYGPLKTVGLNCPPDTYAVVQLRQDDVAGSLYSPVGFQTNLTFPEQKRVFGLIPGLENAKYARFGLMHRNTYVNAPSCLDRTLCLKNDPNIYIAGQLSGVEGYCESAAMGLLAACYVYQRLSNEKVEYIPVNTLMGSLANYLVMSSPNHFAPMNATFGIIATTHSRKDHQLLRDESLGKLDEWVKKNLHI